jgi:hypothetical protein
MCLLLMSSTSFVDLPFQEHRMTEKHHMDQNPCVSSICHEGMMWHKARAQLSQSGAGQHRLLGRPARCWCHFNFRFANVLSRVGARGIRCTKSVEAELGGRPTMCTTDQPGFGELPPQINGGAHSLLL